MHQLFSVLILAYIYIYTKEGKLTFVMSNLCLLLPFRLAIHIWMSIKTRRDDLSTYGIMGCYPMRPGPTLPTTAVLTLQIINYAQSSMGGTILDP